MNHYRKGRFARSIVVAILALACSGNALAQSASGEATVASTRNDIEAERRTRNGT